MQNEDRFDPAQSPEELAEYIVQISGELAALAGKANLTTLAYLLEMVYLEARSPTELNRPAPRAAKGK